MEVKDRIKNVCSKAHEQGQGVMPPQVCPYCYGCPIATIVNGVNDKNNVTSALPIPEKHLKSVTDWLEKLEIKYK